MRSHCLALLIYRKEDDWLGDVEHLRDAHFEVDMHGQQGVDSTELKPLQLAHHKDAASACTDRRQSPHMPRAPSFRLTTFRLKEDFSRRGAFNKHRTICSHIMLTSSMRSASVALSSTRRCASCPTSVRSRAASASAASLSASRPCGSNALDSTGRL